MPYISYGILAWGKSSAYLLNRITILQKRALRIVLTFVPIQIHYSLTTELLKSLTSTHFSLEYLCINLFPIIYPYPFRICLCLIHKSILIKLDIYMIFIFLVFTHQNPLIGTPLTIILKNAYLFKKKTQKCPFRKIP